MEFLGFGVDMQSAEFETLVLAVQELDEEDLPPLHTKLLLGKEELGSIREKSDYGGVYIVRFCFECKYSVIEGSKYTFRSGYLKAIVVTFCALTKPFVLGLPVGVDNDSWTQILGRARPTPCYNWSIGSRQTFLDSD